ncbi:hypothetical protein FOL47_003835 [Perkinsus chesapeaki]|uniref:Uncharacterized protein n=1 Tax=Perkinsus chesapeaki TaxID=330153 RepID=A0A7J6M683_PERCH|nr:hypothetical protein FOL47_003835 [Perkinsus chesapeaki]
MGCSSSKVPVEVAVSDPADAASSPTTTASSPTLNMKKVKANADAGGVRAANTTAGSAARGGGVKSATAVTAAAAADASTTNSATLSHGQSSSPDFSSDDTQREMSSNSGGGNSSSKSHDHHHHSAHRQQQQRRRSRRRQHDSSFSSGASDAAADETVAAAAASSRSRSGQRSSNNSATGGSDSVSTPVVAPWDPKRSRRYRNGGYYSAPSNRSLYSVNGYGGGYGGNMSTISRGRSAELGSVYSAAPSVYGGRLPVRGGASSVYSGYSPAAPRMMPPQATRSVPSLFTTGMGNGPTSAYPAYGAARQRYMVSATAQTRGRRSVVGVSSY